MLTFGLFLRNFFSRTTDSKTKVTTTGTELPGRGVHFAIINIHQKTWYKKLHGREPSALQIYQELGIKLNRHFLAPTSIHTDWGEPGKSLIAAWLLTTFLMCTCCLPSPCRQWLLHCTLLNWSSLGGFTATPPTSFEGILWHEEEWFIYCWKLNQIILTYQSNKTEVEISPAKLNQFFN